MENKVRLTKKGIVLSSTPFKDDSAMITLAGETGVFSTLAKGVYKPKSQLKPLLIVGNILELDCTGMKEDFYVAQSVMVCFDASGMTMNLKTSSFLFFFQELCLSLFHFGDRFPFYDVQQILYSMSKDNDVLSLSILFLGSLYRCLGLNMNTHECVFCGRKDHITSYSYKDGGFICSECMTEDHESKDNMDLYVLKFAFSGLNQSILTKKVPFDSGYRIFNGLYENILDYFDIRPLKSFSFLLRTLSDDL